MSNATQIIHSIPVNPLSRTLLVPIYQTSAFVHDTPGVNKNYDHKRTAHPTKNVLENIIAQLAERRVGAAFAEVKTKFLYALKHKV